MRRIRRAADLRANGSREAGFTLIEMVVGLLILTVISSIAFTVITQLMSEGQAITDSVVGIQQSDRANESILQYLRGVTSFIGATQTASSLSANSNVGYNSGQVVGGTTLPPPYGPVNDVLSATWTAGSGRTDATFTVTINSNVFTEYYARPVVVAGVTQPTFTYYKDNGAGGLTALTSPVPACAYPEIYAVGIQVSFLAGPQRPTEGYAADQATTLLTTIYLRNPTNAASTTTSSTTTTAVCSE